MAAAPSSISSSSVSSSSVSSSLIMSSPSSGLKMACRRSLSGVASFHSHSAIDALCPARLFPTKREHLWWNHDWRLVRNHVCRARPLLSTRACGNHDNLFSREESRTQWMSRREISRNSGICGVTASSQGVSANKSAFSNWKAGEKYAITLARMVTSGPDLSTESVNLEQEVDRDVSIVNDMLNFLNESWTPFHATAEAKRQLLKAGFVQLKEEQEWAVQPGGRYFFTRNMSSIFAFAIGQKYEVGNGFHVVAAHTDSPCPKLKPVSAAAKAGFLNVGVQTYGSGLWHTWFDRDLSVAGRVLLRRENGTIVQELLKVERPIMRIPTLAIHLDRTVNTDGFKPNLETHLAPVLATQIKTELLGKSELGSQIEGGNGALNSSKKTHHPLLLEVLAEQLNCSVEEIVDFELNVCDTQPSCLGGARKEFIFSGRLDNLASSYCALRALLDTCSESASLADESCIRAIALFDNEEVGSDSAQGAGSPMMFQAMGRITRWLTRHTPSEGIEERTIRKSFLVSADMAHALHPNYADRHEENHQPKLREGLVIKFNANQRYATNTVTAFLFKEVAKVAGVPTQNFVVRNDMGCGSTIGPILASGIGIRTVDCGMPQLSMHSIREMCGAEDVDISYRHFKAFFELFAAIDKLTVDT